MQYVNAIRESLVIKFLSTYHPKGTKFEADFFFDEISDFGWIYEVIAKNKNNEKICKYNFNIEDFYLIGTISQGKRSVERFDYSDAWQEYVYHLLNKGILKAIKGNQKTYKNDCALEKEKRSNKSL